VSREVKMFYVTPPTYVLSSCGQLEDYFMVRFCQSNVESSKSLAFLWTRLDNIQTYITYI